MHKKDEIYKAALCLSKKVMDLDEQCDYSKLNEIELEKIKDAAAQARMIFCDLSALDEDRSFS
jgi:hypothetical protein